MIKIRMLSGLVVFAISASCSFADELPSNQDMVTGGAAIIRDSGVLDVNSPASAQQLPTDSEMMKQGKDLLEGVNINTSKTEPSASQSKNNSSVKKVTPLSSLNSTSKRNAQINANDELAAKMKKIEALPVDKNTYPIQDIPAFMNKAASKSQINNLLSTVASPPSANTESDHNRGYALAVMISFSMPDALIKKYSQQAKEAGAVLLTRGLYQNSLTKTVSKAITVNPSMAAWQIDPVQFRRFKVDKVPAIVLIDNNDAKTMTDGCAPEVSYLKVEGDISVRQALDIMRLRGDKKLAALAGNKLSDLESDQKNNQQ
jgi:type-F conjugative transfer system pilin assembly protein TrbC